MLTRFICLLIGYAFGCLQTAYFVGLLNRIDIRRFGSGNLGTTNTARILGLASGLIVLGGDILKTVLGTMVVQWLYGQSQPELLLVLKAYAFVGCMLGHNYPFYLGFRGGKGVAVTIGFLLVLQPYLFLAWAAAALIAFLPTRYMSLASMTGCVTAAILTPILGRFGFWGMTAPARTEMYILLALAALLVIFQHRSNIRRILSGSESRFSFREAGSAAREVMPKSYDGRKSGGAKRNDVGKDVGKE